VQQIAPRMPHGAQLPAVQVAPPTQLLPPQHAWPTPPHTAHVPALPQVSPPKQSVPAQHGSPGPPQDAQSPVLALQPAPGSQLPSPQHAVPIAPHRVQRSPVDEGAQRSVAPQLLPAQHGWPAPPQTTQVVPAQLAPALQLTPPQHG